MAERGRNSALLRVNLSVINSGHRTNEVGNIDWSIPLNEQIQRARRGGNN